MSNEGWIITNLFITLINLFVLLISVKFFTQIDK